MNRTEHADNRLIQKNRLAKNTQRRTKNLKKWFLMSRQARAGGFSTKSSSLVILDCNNNNNTEQTTTTTTEQKLLEKLLELFTCETTLEKYNRIAFPEFKLYLAQYILHTKQDQEFISVPFTYRLPSRLHNEDIKVISDSFQKLLKKTLNRTILMWFTLEKTTEATDHIHAEILLKKSEIKNFCRALRKHFKWREGGVTAALNNKHLNNKHIVRTSLNRRKSLPESSSIFNWVNYSTKQIVETRQQHVRKDCMKAFTTQFPNENVYISAELKKLSSSFYNNNVRKIQKNRK